MYEAPKKVNVKLPLSTPGRHIGEVTVWSTSRPGRFTAGGRISEQRNAKQRRTFQRAVESHVTDNFRDRRVPYKWAG